MTGKQIHSKKGMKSMKHSFKRTLSLLLALVMALSCMSLSAFAETVENCPGDCTHVAAIGNTHYDTLAAAVAAVKAAESSNTTTVTLLKDTDEVIDIDFAYPIQINGQGYGLAQVSSDTHHALGITANNANVTLDNVVVGNMKIGRGVNVNAANVTLAVQNNSAVYGNSYTINVYGTGHAVDNVDITISGSIVEGWAALNLWGNGGVVTVTDSTLTGTNNKSYTSERGYAGNDFGVIVFESNGSSTSDYAQNYTVNISGTTINAAHPTGNNEAVVLYNPYAANNTVKLNDCTITRTDAETCPVLEELEGTTGNKTYAKGLSESSASPELPTGYAYGVADANGYQLITKDVAQVGETTYATLDAAVAAESTTVDTPIYLLADIEYDTNSNLNITKSVVIDGQGQYTVSGGMQGGTAGTGEKPQYGPITVWPNETIDSVTLQNLTIGKTAGNAAFLTAGATTTTLTNVNVTALGATGIYSADGTTTLTNCTVGNTGVNSGADFRDSALQVSGGSTLVVKSGTYSSNKYVANTLTSGGIINIEGGDFTGELYVYDTTPEKYYNLYGCGEINISGGTFHNVTFTVKTGTHPGSITITGGTFDADPTAYVAPGYIVTANGNGTWTVVPDVHYVAQIGDDKYETLTAAVAAANETEGMQTIEILSDITLTGLQSITTDVTIALGTHSISRTSDYANSNTPVFYVQGAANLNITGTTGSISVTNSGPAPAIMNAGTGKVTVSGGVIEANSTGSYSIGIFNTSTGSVEVAGGAVNSGNYGIYNGTGSVTVTSGTINSTNGYGIYNSTGTVAISDGTITGNQYGIWSKGNVTMTNGTVIGGSWGFAMIGTATLNLEGGVVKSSGYAISTNGNAGEDCTINISGGTITGTELGVYQPSGKLNISGGTITGATGVYFKSTDITISGGTIIGTAEKSDYSYNGNGANATGDALVVDSCNYPNGIGTISISGGTYTSTYGNAVGSYNSKGGKLQTGFITGGTFSSDPMLFAGGNLVKVDYASVKQTDDPATYKVGKVETTSVTAGERNTANDTVSYNMTTTVTDVVSSVELSSVTNTAVTVAGTKVNQESGITVTDSSTKTNAVGAAALDNVAGTSMNSVVSNAIRSAGENAGSVKRIELVVVKGDTDTTTDTSTSKVTKVTYEVHPEAIAYTVENEKSTKVGSYKISNDQLAESASFVIKLAVPNDIYEAAYAANNSSPKVKVTHISDDEDYADTEETLGIQGKPGNYYVEVTTSHFSEFSLEPDIQTTATTGNSVHACNLQLQGIIKVQYALNLTETIKRDANSYVVITMPNVGRSETIKVSDAANNAGYKVFGFSVAAQYMDEDTYVTLYNGAGAKVAFDNSNVADGEYAGSYLYGVYSYLNSNTVKHGSAYLQTLASSMKTYNQYAKYYFHPKEMIKPTHALPSITSESLNAYAKTTSGSIDGLTMYAANLQLKASTTVQIAYSGDISGVAFSYTLKEGNATHKSGDLEPVANGNYWVVAIPDIAAQYLDDVLTVTAKKDTQEYKVTYSPFTYVSNMLSSSKVGLPETVRAFYGYNQAANEYFANK